MGVSFVFKWFPAQLLPSQVEENLQAHLLNLGAKTVSTWCMDCEQFSAASNISALTGKGFQLIHTSENESLSFAVTDQGSVLVSERSFDTIVTKLSECYQPNQHTKVEAKGKKYEIGDFAIKVGSVFLGPSFRALVLEVEYMPSSHTKETLPLLQEFLSIVCSNAVPLPDNLNVPTTTPNFYQLSDTISQYWRVFNECRRMPTR